jgi:glycine/D-amino acid oxidase-like deaminating enzyme
MYDFVVVGGGLFGQIIARSFWKTGAQVCIVDDHRPLSGSQAAACLMKPSWASSLPGDSYAEAIAHLETLYGRVTDLRLKIRGTPKNVEVSWINPQFILDPAEKGAYRISDRALSVDSDGVRTQNNGFIEAARGVIVATGAWIDELLPTYAGRLTPKGGWAFTWFGQIDEPFMKVWAPYRQIIGFNRGPQEIWCGDGTALIKKSFHECGTMHKSMKRCIEALGQYADPNYGPKILAGYRPYLNGGPKVPALMEKVKPGLYVASGGGKNGTLGAAWSALRLLEELK